MTVAMVVLLGAAGSARAQSNVAQSIRYGEIVSMDKTIIEVRSDNTGAQVGSTVGAVAGYALASGRDRWLGALVGGVLGGASGRAADKAGRKKKGWQLIIKMEESGEEIGVPVVGKKKPDYDVGDRVRLLTGGGKTQVQRAPA